MGTDIHLYVERKTDHGWEFVPSPEDWDPEWRAHWEEWSMERHYDDFGRLAGLRGGTAEIEPRGLPPDVSSIVHEEWTNFGDHTPSWWTLAELRKHFGPDRYETPGGVVTALAGYDGFDTRIVFWFDS